MSGRLPRSPVTKPVADPPPVKKGTTTPQAATPPAGGTVRKGQKAPPVEKKLPADIDETLNGYAKQFHAGQNLPRFQVRMESLMSKGLAPDRIIKEMQSRGILVTHDPATKRWTLKDTVAQAEAPPTNIPAGDKGPVTSADNSLPSPADSDSEIARMDEISRAGEDEQMMLDAGFTEQEIVDMPDDEYRLKVADLRRKLGRDAAPAPATQKQPTARQGTVDKSAELRDNENTVLADFGFTEKQIASMTPQQRQDTLDSIRLQAVKSSPLKTGAKEAAAQAAETAAANGAVVPDSPPAPPTGDATPATQTVATPTPSRFRRISDDDADALLRTGLYDEAHIDRMDAMASDEAIARAVQDARLRAPVAPPPNPLAGLSSLGITTSPTGGVTVPSPAATTPPPSPAPAPQPMPQPMPGPGPLAGLGINVATPGLPPAGPPMPPASPAGQAVNPYMARLSASQNPSTKMIQALSAWNRNQQSPGVNQPQPQTQAPPKKTLIERLGMRPTKIDPVPALYRNAPAVAASLAKGLGYGLIGTGIGYGVDRATGGNFVRWLTGGQGGQDEDAEYYEALKGLSQPIWPNGVPPQFQTKPGE